MYKVKLKIADIIIEAKSNFALGPSDEDFSFRYKNFFYEGNKPPDISLEVFLTNKMPEISKKTKRIFLTRHPDSNEINWALFKNNRYYVLREYPSEKRQHYILNDNFSKARVYLLRKNKDKFSWKLEEIIYDALQVILIQYISKRDGIFTHAVGIKDNDNSGFLFLGKSGQGKSTTARLWHEHSNAKVLNDDRIIIRKAGGKFFIYGTPWHGDFSDYLASTVDSARLKNIFFIYHSKKNQALLNKEGVFKLLYPCVFPAFWDAQGIEKIITFSRDLFQIVPSYKMGFKNTKDIIGFVRNIASTEARNGCR